MTSNSNCLQAFLRITCLLAFFIFSSFYASSQSVSGKIAEANGTPISGATVTVKGGTLATQTDANGSFTIAAASNATLVITAIGFSTLEVSVDNKTTLSITLQSSSSQLEQIVVVGYGTQKRRDVTGSVSSVNAEMIEKIPVVRVDQALQGRAAGVQVTNNDGAPGGNLSVLIRGVGSLASGGNSPLYVVDGYPITGGINNINPNDIATIDVLKDASATSIYGIRAANGVVNITTKRGKRTGLEVSLDGYTSFQSEPKKYKILNAQQWATLANEVADNDPQQNFVELPIWRTPNALHNIDWQDALYRTGLMQNYTLAIRGGTDKTQTSASIGYFNQKGIVEGSYFKRFTVGLNMDYTPSSWLKSSTSAKYAYQDAVVPFGTGPLVLLSQLPPTMDSGNRFTPFIKDAAGNYGFYNPKNTYVAKYSNPLYTIEKNQYENITNFFLVSSSLEIQPVNGLKIKTNAGVNINNYSGSFFQPEDNRLNEQYQLGGATQNAAYSQNLSQVFEWLWENTIAYDKTFGDHALSFVGGVSAQKNTNTRMGGSGIPPNNVIRDLAQVSNLRLDAEGNGKAVYTLSSQFARLNYKYADKYMLTATIRRDGSSKFDTGHQYGVFPSAAIAWRVKSESFMDAVDWLHDLKIRASYGVVGNESPIGLFRYQSLYSTGAAASNSGNLGYPFNKLYQRGTAQTQPANPELKWETDYQTDIGFDASFLQGRLMVTVDWFKRKSEDFLLTLAAPAQTGYNFITRNVGSMENTGLEFALNYNHKSASRFQWSLGLTVTTIKNKLTSLTAAAQSLTNFGGLMVAGNGWAEYSQTYVGGSIGEFYGYQSLGIFQTQAQIDALNAAAKAKNPAFEYYQRPVNIPGDRYFADINGDGHVDANDRTSLGSPLPKFFSGLNFDATYGNFDFNLYFYGSFGNKIFNYQKSSLQSFQNRSFVGVQNVSVEYFENRWTPDNPSNEFGRATYNDDATGSGVPSSAWVEDGSFVKLKTFTVGYTIPKSLGQRFMIQRLRVYLSTQNLFTITKYSGLDPEIGIQGGNATQNGIDNGTYPSSRFFTFGISAGF
jgi:TonB-dependent starch-binding outer membrane protein SusC